MGGGGRGVQVLWLHVGEDMVSLACSRRLDSSAGENFTKKRNWASRFPPPPVFPVYNTRSRFPSSDLRAPLSERLEQAMVS